MGNTTLAGGAVRSRIVAGRTGSGSLLGVLIPGGMATTLVPTARPRNRNERLSRFVLIHAPSRAGGGWRRDGRTLRGRAPSGTLARHAGAAATRRGRRSCRGAGWPRHAGADGSRVAGEQAGYVGAGGLIPPLGRGDGRLLELLSGGRVKSPEGGPGMTLLGHAGASGRVVALLPEVRGSARQWRWARCERVSICESTTLWRSTRSNSTRKSSAP
jgi:hypothetical protein